MYVGIYRKCVMYRSVDIGRYHCEKARGRPNFFGLIPRKLRYLNSRDRVAKWKQTVGYSKSLSLFQSSSFF